MDITRFLLERGQKAEQSAQAACGGGRARGFGEIGGVSAGRSAENGRSHRSM